MGHELTTYQQSQYFVLGDLIPLKYVVKKVKGHYYVYLQGRNSEGKVVTKYIGPLERIVEAYLKINGDSWWARGDLNPRPPPREGGVLTGLDDGPCQIIF